MAIGKIADVRLTAKTVEFSGFLKDFERKLNGTYTMQQIVDGEVAKVLEGALRLTGKASRDKMRSKIGGLKVITLGGKKQGLFNKKRGQYQRFSDAKWAEITTQKKVLLALLFGAIGLTKQSWYLLAQLMGYNISTPDFVIKALPSKHRSAVNSLGNVKIVRTKIGTANYGIEITNKMPVLDVPHGPQGIRAFFSALAGRIGYFKKSMALGVFNDAAQVAKRYPGIKVTTGF